jgi:hypothetical protein
VKENLRGGLVLAVELQEINCARTHVNYPTVARLVHRANVEIDCKPTHVEWVDEPGLRLSIVEYELNGYIREGIVRLCGRIRVNDPFATRRVIV